eukprot:SAG31_NODE_2106_length_6430_cov_3.620755_2_plen_54_part_00
MHLSEPTTGRLRFCVEKIPVDGRFALFGVAILQAGEMAPFEFGFGTCGVGYQY